MFTENKVCSESSLPTSFISILYVKYSSRAVVEKLRRNEKLCQNLTSQAEADPRGGKAGLPGGNGRDQHRPRGPS